MATLEIWPEARVENAESVTVSATLERPGGAGRLLLWYRIPSSFRAALSANMDPLVRAVVFTAMRTASRLVVHGAASPSLLRNLEEFQTAWVAWKPALYHRVEITAEAEQEPEPAGNESAVMGFSGGADSAFTAWRHRVGAMGRAQCNLRAAVMVHGFDIPLDDPGGYEAAAVRSEAMLSSLGVPLIRMATNFRELQDVWEDAHGAGLASCLSLLQGQHRIGLIASSYPYPLLSLPYGSNPLTDVMLSGDAFRIVHDGAGHNRLEKLRTLIRWPEAMEHMRVCWEGRQRDRNCCRCQKCVSNMLYLRILGQERPKCFPLDISDREIMRTRCPDRASLVSMERLLRVARLEGVSGSWVRALRGSVLLGRIRLALHNT